MNFEKKIEGLDSLLEELPSITYVQKEDFRQKVFSIVKVIFGDDSINFKNIKRVRSLVGLSGSSSRTDFHKYWNRDKAKYNALLKAMKEELLMEKKISMKEYSIVNHEIENPLLKIADLPDVFYERLQAQINRSYYYEIYPAVDIFIRKFIENLIIDLFKSRYGMKQVVLFFDKNRNRYHDFSVLLKNFADKKNDFSPLSPSLTKQFIQNINKFRIIGNTSAHNIELNDDIVKKKIDKNKTELKHIIEILVRILKSISKNEIDNVKKLIDSLHFAVKSGMSLGDEFYEEHHRLQSILMSGALVRMSTEYKSKVLDIVEAYKKE